MATNFCLVKQNLASLSDVANTVDPSTVSGRVTFTPVLGEGQSFHVTVDGEDYTIPTAGITAVIDGGRIGDNGEGVSLLRLAIILILRRLFIVLFILVCVLAILPRLCGLIR